MMRLAYEVRRIALAAFLVTLFAPGGASGQVFRPFAGWDLSDPCLAELIDSYGVQQEINTDDIVAFAQTSTALRQWIYDKGSIVELGDAAWQAETADLQSGNANYVPTPQLQAVQAEVKMILDCMLRVGEILRRVEKQLDELGINTLTMGGSSREERNRRELFAELNRDLDELGRKCQEFLKMRSGVGSASTSAFPSSFTDKDVRTS